MSKYHGQTELLLYLSEQKNLSYYGFLIRHRNIIVESLSSLDTWDDLNNIWTIHFLRESEIIFDEPTYNELKKKTESEQKRRIVKLRTFWKGIVKTVKNSNKENENTFVDDVEHSIKPANKRSIRKRKTICYTESSGDEINSSDSEYTEKSKKQQRSRKRSTKRSCGKVDDTLRSNIITPSLNENTPSPAQQALSSLNNSEDNTLCEITQSALQTPTLFDTLETPCPIIQPAQSAQIYTPNKPIVTKDMCDRYSPYLVCAFCETINYIKETVEEGAYGEIEKLIHRFVLQESFVKKLESIFDTDYDKIESKIFDETIVEGNNQTEEARFNFFVRYTLLDFTANFKYRLPRVLDRDMSERTFIVECLSPIFRAFRNAFPDIKYEWIEKNVTSIKEANNMFLDDISPRKTDLLVLRLSDGMEILSTEVSGPPFKATIAHTVGDAKKLLMMSVCSLCRIFGNNLDCSVKDAKGVKTYSIQIIGDRLTLFSVSLIDQKKYLAVEMASCMIPFSFDSISYYKKIFNFFAIIQTEFTEQERLRKKIYSSIPTENTERIRDWLYLPEDSFFYDLKPVPEDIDEVIIM